MVRKLILLGIICLTIATCLFAASQSRSRKVSVKGLIFDLEHPEADRRIEAARLLGDNKIRQAVPALMKASDDPDEKVRMAVLQALDKIRDNRAQPVFIKLIEDPDRDIRRKAIDALVRLYVLDESGFIAGTKKALNFLNPFDSGYDDLIVEMYIKIPDDIDRALAGRLNDSSDGVRKAAVMSLGIFRARSTLPQLQHALELETEDDIKIEYFRTFYKIGDSSACSSMAPFINDPDKKVHDEAILTSGLLRCVDAVEPLMDIYQSGIKERKTVLGIIPASSSQDLQLKCFEALSMIGDKRAEKLFLPALRHRSNDFRIAAAAGLARVGDPKNLSRVEKYRRTTKSKRFQLALDYALFKMGQHEVLPELVKELGSIRYSDQVYDYLLELTLEEQPQLFPLLRSSKDKTRLKLLEILGLTGSHEALDEIKMYTNDSDSNVVAAALLAERRIRSRLE